MKASQLIFAGRLIDGTGATARPNMILDIHNGYIRQIRNAVPEDAALPDMINLSHCTILPGLVDSHLHLFMSGTDNQDIRIHQLDATFDEIKPVISEHLNQLMAYGIAAVRDGGDQYGHALRYKMQCLNPEETPICVHVAGRAWRKAGRYGKLIGRPPAHDESLADAIAKETDAINHVKLVNSGLNSLKQFGKETAPQFDVSEMTAAVQAAKKRGLKVMVHANGKLPVRISIEAGCDSIEHGFFMGEENLKLMADKNVTWVPTAITMKAYAQQLKDSPGESKISWKNLEHQLAQISRARDIGVSVATGTDAGSLGVHHGKAIIEEISLLMEAGHTIAEAVRCATSNGAALLGLDDCGQLEPGMRATFVAVPGSPDDLPYSLNTIERFYINGCRIK